MNIKNKIIMYSISKIDNCISILENIQSYLNKKLTFKSKKEKFQYLLNRMMEKKKKIKTISPKPVYDEAYYKFTDWLDKQ